MEDEQPSRSRGERRDEGDDSDRSRKTKKIQLFDRDRSRSNIREPEPPKKPTTKKTTNPPPEVTTVASLPSINIAQGIAKYQSAFTNGYKGNVAVDEVNFLSRVTKIVHPDPEIRLDPQGTQF